MLAASDASQEVNTTPTTDRDDEPGPSTERAILWRQRQRTEPTYTTKEQEFTGPIHEASRPQERMNYYRNIIDNEILEKNVDQSNLYALQKKNINKPLDLSLNELEQFLGIVFLHECC